MNDFLYLNGYHAQLQSQEWQKKRDKILNRDNHRCQMCGKGQSLYVKFKDQYWNIGIDYDGYTSSVILSNNFDTFEFKSLICTETIKICKINNVLVGVSDNGVLGGVDIENINVLNSPDNLKINLVKHNSGLLSFVVREKNNHSSSINVKNAPYISDNPIILNVHHKHYIIQHKAWEYNDEDLVTLCNTCHTKIHQTIGVKVYSDENGYMRQIHLTPCSRCAGTGYFPEYKHVENGVCFKCRGARFEELITKD